jgi:uncharacterized paraquat-inducible protein A
MEVLLWMFVFGLLTGVYASSKGYDFASWFLFGALLFVLAAPLMMLKPNLNQVKESQRGGNRHCSTCDEMISKNAKICRYCKSKVTDRAVSLPH